MISIIFLGAVVCIVIAIYSAYQWGHSDGYEAGAIEMWKEIAYQKSETR